jgi:hypothetical protein
MAVAWYLDEVEDWIKARVRQGGKRPPIQGRAPIVAKAAAQPELSCHMPRGDEAPVTES